MRYVLLGNSGLRVSEVCLGTMTFGEDWGWGASRDESRRMFEAFAEAGGNFIDTSNNYTNGASERIVGECVARDRERFVVATKYSLTTRPDDPNGGGNQRKNMVQAVDASLQRLQTDYIDLLWMHMWDGVTPAEEVMRGLDDLVRMGKVLYVGISDTPAWVIARMATLAAERHWAPVQAAQLEYNLIVRGAEHDLLPMARGLGLSVLAWDVLNGGELTGKYAQPGTEPRREKSASPVSAAMAERIGEIAREVGRPPAQVAFNWVRQRAPNIIPLLGARSVAQLQENLGYLEWQLTPDQLQQLTDARPLAPEFPQGFLASDYVHGLIFGTTFGQIVTRG